MDRSEFEHLLALIQAHSIAICAAFAAHPHPDQLRTHFATLCEKTETHFDTANWLLYQSALNTFQKAIPPH